VNELFGVTFKAISDIERIARGLGFETDENAGLVSDASSFRQDLLDLSNEQ